MDRTRCVTLSLVAFGLILVSFVVLGFGRLVLDYRTARLLSAPTMLLAAALVAYLFVRAVLAWTGIRPIE